MLGTGHSPVSMSKGTHGNMRRGGADDATRPGGGLSTRRVAAALVAATLLLASCASGTASLRTAGSTPGPSTPPESTPVLSRPSGGGPSLSPLAGIEHATGPTDVLLRLEDASGESAFGGSIFAPGPIFTLYGDGTVIFQNDLATPPPARGSIVRARPFTIAHLDEGQVQSLLGFALREGGLDSIRQQPSGRPDAVYGSQLGDEFTSALRFTVRAGGLDRRVIVLARDPSLALGPTKDPDARARSAFVALADHLRDFGRGGGIATQAWAPDHYWGVLAGPGWPDCDTAIAWPWPDITPADFVLPQAAAKPAWYWPPFSAEGRRVMSANEAARLGLEDVAGGVRTCITGPVGGANYLFALWPLSPAGPD